MSVVASQKRYLMDKKPFIKHFYPRDMTLTAVRTLTVQGLLVFNNFVASLELDEDSDESESSSEDSDSDLSDAEEANHNARKRKNRKKKQARKAKDRKPKGPEWEPPSKEAFAVDCGIAFVKSMSITTVVRSMESVSIKWCAPQIVDKLVKDVSKSAARKYVRFSSRFSTAIRMMKTGMRANVLSHVAIFIVEEAQQIIVIFYKWYKARKEAKRITNGSPKKHLRSVSSVTEPSESAKFLQITVHNAARSCLGIVTGGVGAALGTMVRPGVGTFVGATLGDTIAYAI